MAKYSTHMRNTHHLEISEMQRQVSVLFPLLFSPQTYTLHFWRCIMNLISFENTYQILAVSSQAQLGEQKLAMEAMKKEEDLKAQVFAPISRSAEHSHHPLVDL